MLNRLSLLSLALLGALACGAADLDEAPQNATDPIEVVAGTPGAPNGGTPDTPLALGQSGDVTAQGHQQCCYAQCRNPDEAWTAPSNRGQPVRGQCGNRAKKFCADRRYRYYHAFWVPCR